MNVILTLQHGLVTGVFLVKDDTAAQETVKQEVIKLGIVPEEISDITDSTELHQKISILLKGSGNELLWFDDVEPNYYNNENSFNSEKQIALVHEEADGELEVGIYSKEDANMMYDMYVSGGSPQVLMCQVIKSHYQ